MNEKVLVIDDDPAFCTMARDLLAEKGYQAYFAGDGKEGLKMASEGMDLIILDLLIPGLNGWEVLKHLKADEQTRHIPIVVCTTRSERLNPHVAESLGAADYICKPFTIDDFWKRVERALARHPR